MAKFASKEQRVRVALAKYYGMGTEDREWTQAEIADYLDVEERTVRRYLNENPIAHGVENAVSEVADQTRKELIMDLRGRLRRLRALEEELSSATDVVVSEYDFETVEGVPQDPTGSVASEETVETEIPVPAEMEEVTDFSRLQKVWHERRRTEEELRKLLGLDEPEEIDVHSEVTERKVWKNVEDDLPEQVVESDAETDE